MSILLHAMQKTIAVPSFVPMTAYQAQEYLNAIKRDLKSTRSLLLELERRRGWEALGYNSWGQCVATEFGSSQWSVYKLLHAAEVEENLARAGIIYSGNPRSIPLNHLEELHKLPPAQQAPALQKANEIAAAQGRPRNTDHITEAVKIFLKQFPSGEPQSEPKSAPTLPKPGDVVGIMAKGRPELFRWHGCWGIVKASDATSCVVVTWRKELNLSSEHLQARVYDTPARKERFKEVCDRIIRLANIKGISSASELFLEGLGQEEDFSPEDLLILEKLEEIYLDVRPMCPIPY